MNQNLLNHDSICPRFCIFWSVQSSSFLLFASNEPGVGAWYMSCNIFQMLLWSQNSNLLSLACDHNRKSGFRTISLCPLHQALAFYGCSLFISTMFVCHETFWPCMDRRCIHDNVRIIRIVLDLRDVILIVTRCNLCPIVVVWIINNELLFDVPIN